MNSHKKIITEALANSISYEQYQQEFDQYVSEGRSSGPNQEEDYVNFTKLNHRRLSRLNKTAKLTDDFIDTLKNITTPQTWLVITETWCGDAVQALPFFRKAEECNSNISLRIVYRDENIPLIDLYLTNGGRSIPKAILLDNDFNEIGPWGPRPTPAQELYMDFRTNPKGREYKDVQIDLQKWYLQDKGITMLQEIKSLIS